MENNGVGEILIGGVRLGFDVNDLILYCLKNVVEEL